ncbi:hypothetical protein [Dinghuibacter silviterrae]|uniref:Uncharacterized protein n=1 Tax=Dinghuibacter silviterrae TaxID=1539049 RepID=A0A4R8DID8_9BACT|nr:hypothetical protein [Dinghuibacter silviterrae]TDW97335.1 hypothetical protein EDB95_5182 [Dinghuibacter silviterrae]
MTSHFTPRIYAILLMAAGYGWAGGHYIPQDAPATAYLFQAVILTILLILSAGVIRAMAAPTPLGRRYVLALTIFAILTLLINLANIVRGMTGAGPGGSHNALVDLVPIGLIIAGDVLWLASLRRSQ